ncbi:MAPEG family protein [Lysobacter sp. D1-1-M9]|uniref:MAPEG family protein n=1 Tax=Novilysobacter longmucuonensis TaxID=3098603 RepID=UPI002FC6477B
MTIELQMLAWTIVLGLVHLLLAAALSTQQRGLKWNAGARDDSPRALTGAAARIGRAWVNFLETFAFFAGAVLAVVLTDRADDGTALGAQLYFWSRLLYVPVYAAGIAYLRTLIWAVSLVGIVMLLLGLF